MFNKKQLIYNGTYKLEEEFTLTTSNRAFLYGDAIFETMFASYGKVHSFNAHIQRLIDGMRALKYEIPNIFIYRKEELHNSIISLLNRNKYFKGTRIRLTVYSNSEGKYTPQKNTVDYIIEANPLNFTEYQLNEKGLIFDVFPEIKKNLSIFSRYKIAGNSLNSILAGKHAKANQLDDCIILNSENNICETVASNIFLVKGNTISTPSLSSACVAGTMRARILELAKQSNYEIVISKNIKVNDLLSADEVFTTNAINGIRWFLIYKNKRYFNRTSVKFTQLLNDQIKQNEDS